MVSATVACLPAAFSLLLLLLEALFMQISGVSLALTWPCRLWFLEFPCVQASGTSFPLSKHTGRVDTAPALSGLHVCLLLPWEVGLPSSPVEFSSHCRFYKLSHSWLLGSAAAPASHSVYLQFTWKVGLPLSPVEFSSLCHSHKLSCSWLLGADLVPTKTLWPARLVYLQFWEGFPDPNLQQSVRHTLFPACLYCYYRLLLFFSFLPGWRSVYPGGYADLAQASQWEYCILLSSPCLCLPKLSGCRQLVARRPS
jgi:hypothetical protein